MTDQRTIVLGSAECPSSVTEPGFYVEVVAGALAGPYTQRGAVHASSRRRNQGQSTVGTVEVVR